MNLNELKNIFINFGCNDIYIKKLSANDNSKNQVYFGNSFDILNIFPLSDIQSVEAGDWKRERFRVLINFFWIMEDGTISSAPNSQLILYPKYPEVRFSGFLKGSINAPSKLMTQRLENRLLFISVDRNRNILGYVTHPNSIISNEFNTINNLALHGVFHKIELPVVENSRSILLKEISRIHKLGWINSKRFNSRGEIISCDAPQCGGYTLEAELGILPNSKAAPDFKGWEIKQFGVKSFEKINTAIITLMTPEPTGGIYQERGLRHFIRNYGYNDKLGRPDRMNFGGIHRINKIHPSTKLELKLIGFDISTGKIRNSNGRIVLLDNQQNEAASWDFSSLLLHWNRKHNKACYVPSKSIIRGKRKYHYGNNIILGTGTDFHLFLRQMALGNIYYDPGIKMENISTKATTKARSQFRIKSVFLPNIYRNNEIINLDEIYP